MKPILALTATAGIVLTAAACGGRSSPASSTSSPAATQPSGTTAATVASRPPAASNPSGKTVTMNVGGYVFQVSLAPPGVGTATTFTTNDSSGTGGTPIDAPPGQTLVIATLTFANKTDRPEPLNLISGALPDIGFGAEMVLAVPQRDAAAFGITPDQSPMYCQNLAPASGYCSLDPVMAAFSPAQTQFGEPPQLAPGQTGTITLLSGGGMQETPPVPQAAPVHDVKVYVETTQDCAANLSGTPQPGCLAALN
jgi:hypothetical protein